MENKELIQMRKKIDGIDKTLMFLLNKRANIAKAIGEIKFREGKLILNKERENEIISKSQKFDNSNFVKSIFIKILEESRRIQERIWK